MNYKSIINDVCCDGRIKNGTLDLKNPDHVFVLQEYLEKNGVNMNYIVDKTATLFEAGRFPERQAYNKNGILVTFPNKEYRDRAVDKGTHFAENPKKADTNIFTEPPADIVAQTTEKPQGSIPIDKELRNDAEQDSDVDNRTPDEKKQDSSAIEYMLTGETPLVNYSIDEAKRNGFYNKGFLWYDSNGTLIGEQVFDESKGAIIVKAAIK